MKFIQICFLFFSLFLANSVLSQKSEIIIVQGDTINMAKDTIVRNKLIHLNLSQFEGKTVSELLKNDTIKLYKNHGFSDEPPFKLRSLYLKFARGLYLEIYFAELKYEPRFSKTGLHSFEKIQKETISKIILDRRFFEENVVNRYGKPK